MQSSYLFRKYSLGDEKFRTICFRGAEYLDDLNDSENAYLIASVRQLDSQLGTNIIDRVTRVIEAKKQISIAKSK